MFKKFIGLSVFLFLFFSYAKMNSAYALVTHYLQNTSEYNISFINSTSELWLFDRFFVGDIDGNGKTDYVFGSEQCDELGRTNNGCVYVIFDTMYDSYSDKIIDLANSQNYNIKIVGAYSNEYLSNFTAMLGDLDNDGKDDLFLGSDASYNGKSESGSVYIISDDILIANKGVGNTLDLLNPANFYLRIDGPTAGMKFGYDAITMGDLNGDELLDLAVGCWPIGCNYAHIFFNTLLNTPTNPNSNVFNLANAGTYNIKLYSSGTNRQFGNDGALIIDDFNSDGKGDLLVGSPREYYNGRTNSGSIFIISADKFTQYSGTDYLLNVGDVGASALRIDGAYAGQYLTFRLNGMILGDANGNGSVDMVIGSHFSSYNSRTYSGSSYLIDGDLIASKWETGVPIDLNSNTNYFARFDGASANGGTGYGANYIVDFNSDGLDDLFISQPYAPYANVGNSGYVSIFSHQTIKSLSQGSNVDLAISSSQSWIYTHGTSSNFGMYTPLIRDLNGDDKVDMIFRSGGAYTLILNFPHTISLDPLPENTAQDMFTLTGSVAAPNSVTSIAGVEWSLDNNPQGTWTACSATNGSFDSLSESFICEVTGYTEGEHQIYVRAYDTNTSYTASSRYASVGKRKDVTAPKLEYIVTDPVTGKGYEKTFKATALNAMDVIGDTHYPQFCFTKAYDDGAGVASYTIVVDGNDYLPNIPYNQPPVGDNGDTRQEGDSIIKENNNYYIKYHLYNDVSKQQEICAYGKTDSHYLEVGVHKWSVKATDNAGNSTSTDTLRFLVMTNQGAQSKPNQSVWFPLSLLQVGNRTNLTTYSTTTPTLFTKDSKPLLFTDSSPIFYGIVPVGATINLTLEKDTTDDVGNINRQQVTTLSTTANDSSEWGVNITTPLTTGTYYVTIQATDTHDNFAILKDIPLKLTPAQASTVLGATTDTNTNQVGANKEGVLGESDQKTGEQEAEPSPTEVLPSQTSRPRPTPTPTPDQFCIWKWCW